MKRLLSLIAVSAVLVTLVVVVLRRGDSQAPRSGNAIAEPERAVATSSGSGSSDIPSLREPTPGDGDEHGEFTTTTDIYKQRLFKTDPELAQFDAFREQVLQDAESKAEYHKLLSDKELMQRMHDDLLHPKYERDTMETNVKRLMQIDYLREALAWKDNPSRSELVSLVSSIVKDDSFTSSMQADVKRSLAATKMELFQILSGHDPALIADMVRAAQGTRLEAMMRYFEETNRNRIAKERELSLQAQANKP